jgi:hypothetical protein
MSQRNVSYGEIIALENEFDAQADGIEFESDEARDECLSDFIQQYIDVNDNPKIRTI